MWNFNDKLQNLLKTDPRFLDQEWNLIRNEIIDKAFRIDERLIELLITDDEIKTKFFCEIKGHRVFNINTFVDFVQDKNFLNDSYTKYKNKIWLNIGGKFLRERNEVSLVRPYKDCILEWGQSKEDQKRKEIFFNEILAQDEIDRLLDPKVLTNFKKYTKDWEKKVESFTRDENGTIKDNLIIKGNNLLALHSLKKEFAGKVKLIYIDPPYNTGNDGFKYNDNFNHSTWLTFMKNRLEVARELLRDDGAIFISSDDNEQAYLKVLMDEVFWINNFVQNFMRLHWKWKKDKNSRTLQQYALCYAYNKSVLESWTDFTSPKGAFSNPDNDPRWERFSGSISFSEDRSNQAHDNYYSITSPSWVVRERQRQCDEDEMWELLKNNKIYFWSSPEFSNVPRLKIFPNDIQEVIPQNIFDWAWTTKSALKELQILWFNTKDFDTPKPEFLMKKIIEISSQSWDIVLDYHLWSWTTCAVAHKMGRQYIWIEQMDYIETIAVERMKKVIDWEQGGISKSVNWQGGGEFIYCELKKYNQDFIDQIQEAKDTEELLKIWENMKAKSFLNYNVELAKQEEAIEEFKQLSLDQKKQALVELLDKNQLYVNLSEINDKDFEVDEEDKRLNDLFYKL